jgi:F0F1-type ATP synthase assembly protein I
MAKPFDSIRNIAPFYNWGIEFVVYIGLGLLVGWWLDEKYETKPWLELAGCLLGIVLGFYQFFKMVLRKEQK